MHSAIFSIALLPALCVASGSSEIYLHPRPSSHAQFSGRALLAHHFGVEKHESRPHEVSTGEAVLGGARPFVGAGQRDSLFLSVHARHPDDVIPQSLHSSFIHSIIPETPSSLLNSFSRFARRTYQYVSNTATKSSQHRPLRLLDIFGLSPVSSTSTSDALEGFLSSLNSVATFLEESGGARAGERFGAFEVIGLKDIEEEWGRQSQQYLTMVASLNAVIQSAIVKDISLALVFPSPKLSVRQPAQPPQSSFPPKKVPATAPVFSTSTCFTSIDACRNATETCSSRGDCVGVTRAGRMCFVCECRKAPLEDGGKDISWAGGMCQKQDISQEFTLIVGTVIFLIVVSVGSVSLLYTISTQQLPGTLTGGLGGPLKRE